MFEAVIIGATNQAFGHQALAQAEEGVITIDREYPKQLEILNTQRSAVIAIEEVTGIDNVCLTCGLRFWTKDGHECKGQP